jgi:hypothetical protein
MKLRFATIILVTLLVGTLESHALTFEGTISGSITSAEDASFLMFSHNPPLVVGDIITGHYSYESPTVNGDIYGQVYGLQIRMQVGSIQLDFSHPYLFEIRDGHVWSFFDEFTDYGYGIPDDPGYGGHLSVDNGGIRIVEVYGYEQSWRSAVGTLVFSDPVTQSVPDTAATGSLLTFAWGALGYLQRRLKQA